jgi:NAD+ synthase (glutamine-hydrolysing)
MGFSYNELSVMGKLRKCEKLGPLGMFKRLLNEWANMSPLEVYYY